MEIYRLHSQEWDQKWELWMNIQSYLLLALSWRIQLFYLDELVQEVSELTSVLVSPATICRLLKRSGFTRKKVRQIAAQRCYVLRGAFMAQCTMFTRDMFVWIDETGSDAWDHICKFGYALRGMTPIAHHLLARGQRVNAIAAFASSGVVCCRPSPWDG